MNHILEVVRWHDISCGHRVYGHESKCQHLHGHNYRIHFTCRAELDDLGRVIDFGIIKEKLCKWLEENWDHKFLIYHKDPLSGKLFELDPEGIYFMPSNPTAENMAIFLMEAGDKILGNPSVHLVKVKVEETAKCAAVCM